MRNFSRWVLALVFLFSGFVKAIDPVGSGLIFTEYFTAFGLDFLIPLAVPFGVLLSTAEWLLGLLLILDYRKVWTAWGVLLFMSFFTVLTFLLALFNLVDDCGCFGEVIKLTHWQTFLKNVILWPFVLFVFCLRHKTPPVARPWFEWTLTGVLGVLIVGVSIYCYRHLPLMDFMGFKEGHHIPTLLEEDEANPPYVFESQWIYEKDGRTAAFSSEHLPDSSWTFVEVQTIEKATGYRPKIGNFTVEELLQEPGYATAVTLYDEKPLSEEAAQRLAYLAQWHAREGLPLYVLSSLAQPQDVLPVVREAPWKFYMVDRKTLLTMVRTSPGLMVWHNGTVVAKFSTVDLPQEEEWEELINSDPQWSITQSRIRANLRVETVIAVTVFLLWLLRWLRRRPGALRTAQPTTSAKTTVSA